MTPPAPCCPPAAKPSAAAYKRHVRAHTVPCDQSLADSNAYRQSRYPKGYAEDQAVVDPDDYSHPHSDVRRSA